MSATAFQDGDPYCTQCGFLLRGHEADPRCPECDAPLPAALARFDSKQVRTTKAGYRNDSAATLFGIPLVSLAFGSDTERGTRRGRAIGIIAIGDAAIGGVAIGGGAIGVVAIGGGAIGVVSIGGGAVGLLGALGGGAIGGYAVGGVAVGGIATGGVAVGYVAQGGSAVGVYARGGAANGTHTIDAARADPAAVEMFNRLAPVLGPSGPGGVMVAAPSMVQMLAPPLAVAGVLAAIIGAAVLFGQRRYERSRKGRESAIDDIVGAAAARRPGR